MTRDELDNLKWRRHVDNERGVAAPYGRDVDTLLTEIVRLRTAFRVNMQRYGATDAQIDEVLNSK